MTAVAMSAPSSSSPTAGLFHNFSKEEIAKVLAAAVLRKVSGGRIITRAHEPATHLYLIKTGAVNYYRLTPEGHEIVLRRLSPGEAFGLGTLLEKPVGHIGTAQAIVETELYVWEHHWVRRLADGHSRLAENALRIALEYIRLYSDRHLALVSGRAEDRLARTLTSLGKRMGQTNTRGVELQITNQHLASLADIGSYTASRLLNKWERKGALEKHRGKVLILYPEKMLE